MIIGQRVGYVQHFSGCHPYYGEGLVLESGKGFVTLQVLGFGSRVEKINAHDVEPIFEDARYTTIEDFRAAINRQGINADVISIVELEDVFNMYTETGFSIKRAVYLFKSYAKEEQRVNACELLDDIRHANYYQD